MKTRTRVLLAATVVLVALVGVLGYVLLGGRSATRELIQAEVEKRPETTGGTYASDFLSGAEGSRVANVYVVVGSWDNICTLLVQVWHEEGTVVDEISLEFDPLPPDALALQNSGGTWPSAELQATSDNRGVIYSIPDAGFQGIGTMQFEFCILEDMLDSAASPSDGISLNIDFTMHKKRTLGTAKQHAKGVICLEIPRVALCREQRISGDLPSFLICFRP